MAFQPQAAFGGGASAPEIDTRALVRQRLAAKRRRTRRIRRAVVALSVAIFLALFATIYVQLASGNDPGVSASSASRPVATSSQAVTSSANTGSTGSSAAPAAVTTSQS
jgi:hypothetical protein